MAASSITGANRFPGEADRSHQETPFRVIAKNTLSFVGIFLLTWVILVAGLIPMEGSFIYFPSRRHDARPEDYGLEAEELWLRAEDGVRLHSWWIRGEGKRVVLFFHGNAGNISHRLDRSRLLVDRLGLDILLLDYRGYGLSAGKPSEAGLYRDARAAYRAAADRGFSAGGIVLFGESIGSAVALELALERPCGAVILETPFLSVPALARKYYPFVPRFLIRTRFDNEKKIPQLAAPKLIIQAERDEIVPPSHARRLFELAVPPKKLYVIPRASHNDTYAAGGSEYIEVWRQFLEDALGKSKRP